MDYIESITRRILLALAIVWILACEVPISVDYEMTEPQIVVDGLITDQPGPYEIKLTYSGAYTPGADGNNPPVTGALVIIRDENGEEEVLTEDNPGLYLTGQDFIGQVGKKYTLSITTVEGKMIESYPEEMLPVPQVDSIYYTFHPIDIDQDQGHEISVVVNDPVEEKNYYRWKWDGYYLFYMVSEMVTLACFRHEFDINRISIISDRDFNGNKIYFPVTFVPHFSNDYYLIHIYQYSLTESAYKFWDLLNQQNSNVGSVFDPQPARIKGNLFYIDDTQEPVLGYFGASAVTFDYLYMNLNARVAPQYPRSYEFKPCHQHPNSFVYDPSHPTFWPIGWGAR
jgi:hypothetical protein